jgi:hypothetical protein
VEALALRRSEIALFVKDVIERQEPLGLDELDYSVAQQSSGICHLLA